MWDFENTWLNLVFVVVCLAVSILIICGLLSWIPIILSL